MNPSISDNSESSQKPLVLVVDDSASMREGISAILRHIGCDVETAINGHKGYEKACECSPDLIISDLEMPEANGFDLLTSVRSDTTLTMVPFIMVTGVSDRASTRQAMELGADDYLTKPFVPEEVMSAVRSRLDKQRNWRQATQALAASYSQGMMGVLPHEFRTPLNSILGFAELMSMIADRGLTPIQTREFAETIQRAGKTLLSHTTRILNLMEYQGLPTPVTEQPKLLITKAWLEKIVNDVLADQLPTNRIEAQIEVVEATVKCRENLLQTMLRELASNAVKFAAPDTPIVIAGAVNNGRYLFCIDNKGSPFPVDKIRQISAFVQFDRDRQEQQGLGIGLAIVAHAARLGNVRLKIANEPGHLVRAKLQLDLSPPSN